MSEQLGQVGRLKINTGTSVDPVWKKVKGEVELTLNGTSSKEKVSNKDTGVHAKYIKTEVDHTSSFTFDVCTDIEADEISWSEIYDMYQETNIDANKGEYQMKFDSVIPGMQTISFNAFIETCSLPLAKNSVVQATATLQVNSLPVAVTVV